MNSLKQWAHKLQSESWVLYRASKDPETPWYAKAFIALVIAYALSPIDLIPDFIPIIGYLDDLILIPIGIYLAAKLIPAEILQKHRRDLVFSSEEKQRIGSVGAKLVFIIWITILILLIFLGRKFFTMGSTSGD